MKKLIPLIIICVLFLPSCVVGGCYEIDIKGPGFQEVLTRDISFKDDIKFISKGRLYEGILSNAQISNTFEKTNVIIYFTDDAVIISVLNEICEDEVHNLKLKEDFKLLYSDIILYGTGLYELNFPKNLSFHKIRFMNLYLGSEQNKFTLSLYNGVLKNTGAKANDILTSVAILFGFLDSKITTKRVSM